MMSMNPFRNVLTVPPSVGPPFRLHHLLLITRLSVIKYSRCCGCLRILAFSCRRFLTRVLYL